MHANFSIRMQKPRGGDRGLRSAVDLPAWVRLAVAARSAPRDFTRFPVDAFLTLRPVRPEDEPFLRELRAQVDVERLGLRRWSPEAGALARKVLESQFQSHAAHYRRVKSNSDTKDCVIELNGAPVGRFIVTQDAETVYISDLAVHPDFRGQGLGQGVIAATQHECAGSRRLLHLHVDRTNSAVQFYLGLGFRVIGDDDVQFLMEWVPPGLVGRTQVFAPGPAS